MKYKNKRTELLKREKERERDKQKVSTFEK
jgi:hypothetical protein